MTRRLLVAQWLFMSVCATNVLGQESPILQQAAAKARAKLEATIPKLPPLEVSQLGGLRQDAYSIQESLGTLDSARLRGIDFVEVFPATYVVVNGRLQTTTVGLDSEPAWLVATDQESGEWFFLYGFPEATTVSEFNRLVQHLGLAVKSDQAAIDLFDFYLKVAKGPAYRGSIPSDEISLQAIVSQDYVMRFPPDQRAAKFKGWWARGGVARKGLGPPKVLRAGELFQVRFFRYRQDELLTQDVFFSPAGLVSTDGH